jgi:hypothetical protein
MMPVRGGEAPESSHQDHTMPYLPLPFEELHQGDLCEEVIEEVGEGGASSTSGQVLIRPHD